MNNESDWRLCTFKPFYNYTYNESISSDYEMNLKEVKENCVQSVISRILFNYSFEYLFFNKILDFSRRWNIF
jgi:hypothetical protein